MPVPFRTVPNVIYAALECVLKVTAINCPGAIPGSRPYRVPLLTASDVFSHLGYPEFLGPPHSRPPVLFATRNCSNFYGATDTAFS